MFEQTGRLEGLRRLLDSFYYSYNPSQSYLALLQTYTRVLQSMLNVGEEDVIGRRGSRTEVRLRKIWSLSVLDLAAQFSVPLDGVSKNLQDKQQTEPPKSCDLVWNDE